MGRDTVTLSFVEKLWNTPFSRASMEKAKYGLMDYIASSYAGKDDTGVAKLVRMARLEGGHPLAPVLFHSMDVSPSQSALINGFMGHALDYDDVHSQVRGHPSTVILPALLAVCDAGTTGRRFLEAYIIGVEAMARIAQALTNEHYERGFHNTGTTGVLAATLAGAYLKSYSVEKACLALGFATTQASGLRVHFGTETKPLHAGLAASSAVRALLLADADVQANKASLDGEIGFFAVFGQGIERARELLLQESGPAWRIETPGLWFKLYPFCSGAYYGVHAAEKIGPIPLERIAGIEIIFPHRSDAALVHRNPSNGEEGRFSIEYITALILSGRGLRPDDFQRVPIGEDIRSYMEKMKRINVFDVPAGRRYTQITVKLTDGNTISETGDCPKGSPGNPVTEQELISKFAGIVKSEHASVVLDRILKLDETENVQAFAKQLGEL
ncbi:MmgE/PrpD family protein [Paenibacillus sp. 32O-W]|uniref:MmgE/PrpD family protein n=1 Tax=Paenibacillus sp. 32O-W TaxID=1695218 RepID=UPI00071F9626|nr:MmgE/PrpD family protein [Paenibacillus sp. 32O-W]ALS26411.1 MmgE/PrpD family protein [Paenibacillus sp. 32O-W]